MLKYKFLLILAVIVLTFQIATAQKRTELPQKITVSDMPDAPVSKLGAPRKLQPGVLVYEAQVISGQGLGSVWIYLPEKPAAEKLPCILVAPAGSRLIDGASLGEGGRAEHIPYVKAGMIVVAYEIDGEPVDESDDATIVAMAAFKRSNAGLINQKAALDLALENLRQIDTNKIYAAGHSSAATHALLVAANEPRVKGVIAYAPATDIEKFLGPSLAALDKQVSGFRKFIAAGSPVNNIARINVPVFLFHSTADETVPVKMTEDFVAKLKKANLDVTFVKATSGDHYYSMIHAGIPKAITWIQSRSK
jgi:dipeptidyl aminopeptidase/acylaminoacyl peptidase